jgi:hypothetical protein
MKKIISIIIFITSFLTVSAQNDNSIRKINHITSPAGNYLYLCNLDQFLTKDSNLINATSYFIVERTMYDNATRQYLENSKKVVGTARMIQTKNDLKNYLTNDFVEGFKKAFNVKNENELVNYFQKHNHPRYFSLMYMFIETKMAMGHVFFDKDVKQGEVYRYTVTRVDNNKAQEFWGNCVVESKIGNYELNYLKPLVDTAVTFDSSIYINWKLPITNSVFNLYSHSLKGLFNII